MTNLSQAGSEIGAMAALMRRGCSPRASPLAPATHGIAKNLLIFEAAHQLKAACAPRYDCSARTNAVRVRYDACGAPYRRTSYPAA
eukprot:6189534-Pleurochrysis_carterae.AAC.8